MDVKLPGSALCALPNIFSDVGTGLEGLGLERLQSPPDWRGATAVVDRPE